MDRIKMNHKMDKTFEEGFEEFVLDMKARNLRQGTIELRIIRNRVKSGMANAKAKDVAINRPHLTKDQIPSIFYKHYPSYKNKQLNISELARVCGMSRTTIYKYLELLEN